MLLGSDDNDSIKAEMPFSDGEKTGTQSMSLDEQEITKRKLNFEKLDLEFAKVTGKIKEALCRNNICVHSLVEQLCAMSAVKDKKVPLFDEDVFEKVTTIEELWKILRGYWTIRDYDMLIFVIDIAECKEAKKIFDDFLSTVDTSLLEGIELVLQCKEYDEEGFKPLLRIKVGEKEYTKAIEDKVKEVISAKFNLEKYSLCFKGIKEGCIEIIYEISNALSSYLLQCSISGNDLAKFAAFNILSLHIGDMKLAVPSELGDMVGIC